MGRIKLTVSYDGTGYSGWQQQENAVTVCGVLTDRLRELLKEEVILIGASRTDAGVHALGNVAVFDTETAIPPEIIAYAVNSRLPEDIRVVKSEAVPDTFHPRFDAHSKCYEYLVSVGEIEDPLSRLYSHHIRTMPDVEKMNAAAGYLVGEHDFSSFCAANAQVSSKVRTIYSLTVLKTENGIKIRVIGNGFLYNMVRIIAGTLLKAGEGKLEPASIPEILAAEKREKAGPTAPAKGLRLCWIRYEEEE